MTPQEFIQKWTLSMLGERQGSQEHFIDLCHLLGQKTPADADPEGTWYCFEKGTAKYGGGDGWADVWRKGCFAWVCWSSDIGHRPVQAQTILSQSFRISEIPQSEEVLGGPDAPQDPHSSRLEPAGEVRDPPHPGAEPLHLHGTPGQGGAQ